MKFNNTFDICYVTIKRLQTVSMVMRGSKNLKHMGPQRIYRTLRIRKEYVCYFWIQIHFKLYCFMINMHFFYNAVLSYFLLIYVLLPCILLFFYPP